jgi:hypothetical protein
LRGDSRREALTLWLPGLIREGGRRVEEGVGRRDLSVDRHWQRVPAQKKYGVKKGDFSAILITIRGKMEKGQGTELRWST